MKKNFKYIIVLIIVLLVIGVILKIMKSKNDKNYVSNPIMHDGADPYISLINDTYIYTQTTGRDITIWQTDNPAELSSANKKVIYRPTNGEKNLWAPEVHYYNGHYYIYYASVKNNDDIHKMYVLKSKENDPFSEYEELGIIEDINAKWAIDGTIVENNGEYYFVWSGWENNTNVSQNLYIAKMTSPTELEGERVQISAPEYDWEVFGAPPSINEGPQILKKDNLIHIIYSASGSWTDEYKLGQLTINSNDDLLNPNNWIKKSEPVFKSSNGEYGPGHASFFTSKDNKENWILYHCAKYQGAGWNRNVRMQQFKFDKNGNPVFGDIVPVDEKIKSDYFYN